MHSERAVVLAPHGRDAIVASAMLNEAMIASAICDNVGALLLELDVGAGFALVTEEALRDADLSALARWITDQPEWSDFPFVLLTRREGGLERNPAARRYLEILGNVTFLERPFHPTTLISLAQSAVRGRRRQYDARARLEELHAFTTELERRVEDRTAAHEAAVAQLHEAQKLETLGQLTGGVAHDFNNLLTPITGALDLLQRKYAEQDPRSGKLIANALLAADRAKTLVQRLLGFARRQELQSVALDVADLIAGMHDLIASSVGATVELHIDPAPDLPPALADPNQLELAILNLCINARDAMPNGGPLTISSEKVDIAPGSAFGLPVGTYIRLSVIDTGVGMDAETLTRAVEPFYSTKETGRGTGLGLSMVHGLAAQLGGRFVLTSRPGHGTRADLYLPMAKASDALRGPERVNLILPVDRPLSVILVDDEDIVRTGTAEMIRYLGHNVIEARGGAEALTLLADAAEVDVVITDYKMPRMDGAELSRRLKDQYPQLPVLIITGYTGTTDDVLHLPRLAKPFGQSEIAAALAALTVENDSLVSLRR
ncbi:ATP-binding protein [Sphingobium subterraneum]|uniref:histidine kinase n=1 Tax=Sphingobium subterraneum TaxID=627688 RepID=A0A841J8H2_9SPHN|nr:ATP-binding protein [Sphingobium subterraneum]MBB6124848.1 signal transduction histidine kinase/ActR/RegA family two-component response regulator [Sphingobium subterraneum]